MVPTSGIVTQKSPQIFYILRLNQLLRAYSDLPRAFKARAKAVSAVPAAEAHQHLPCEQNLDTAAKKAACNMMSGSMHALK